MFYMIYQDTSNGILIEVYVYTKISDIDRHGDKDKYVTIMHSQPQHLLGPSSDHLEMHHMPFHSSEDMDCSLIRA